TDRSRRSLSRIGCAHHLSRSGNDSFTLPYHRKYGARRNEADEFLEKRPFLMLCIMFSCKAIRNRHHLRGDEFESFFFKAGNNLTDQMPFNTVRFYHQKCFFHTISSLHTNLSDVTLSPL